MSAIITISYDDDGEDAVFHVDAFSMVIVGKTNPDDDGDAHSEGTSRQRSFTYGMTDAEAVGYALWGLDNAKGGLHRGDYIEE